MNKRTQKRVASTSYLADSRRLKQSSMVGKRSSNAEVKIEDHEKINSYFQELGERIKACKTKIRDLTLKQSSKTPIKREFISPPPIPLTEDLKQGLISVKTTPFYSYLMNNLFKKFFKQVHEIECLIEGLHKRGMQLEKTETDLKFKISKIKEQSVLSKIQAEPSNTSRNGLQNEGEEGIKNMIDDELYYSTVDEHKNFSTNLFFSKDKEQDKLRDITGLSSQEKEAYEFEGKEFMIYKHRNSHKGSDRDLNEEYAKTNKKINGFHESYQETEHKFYEKNYDSEFKSYQKSSEIDYLYPNKNTKLIKMDRTYPENPTDDERKLYETRLAYYSHSKEDNSRNDFLKQWDSMSSRLTHLRQNPIPQDLIDVQEELWDKATKLQDWEEFLLNKESFLNQKREELEQTKISISSSDFKLKEDTLDAREIELLNYLNILKAKERHLQEKAEELKYLFNAAIEKTKKYKLNS